MAAEVTTVSTNRAQDDRSPVAVHDRQNGGNSIELVADGKHGERRLSSQTSGEYQCALIVHRLTVERRYIVLLGDD